MKAKEVCLHLGNFKCCFVAAAMRLRELSNKIEMPFFKKLDTVIEIFGLFIF